MIELRELLNTQKLFADSLHTTPPSEHYVFAMNIEISEFMNKLPWKWWKKNQTVDKADILDELADVMAFWLSWYLQYFKKYKESRHIPLEQIEIDIDNMINLLEYQLNATKKPTHSHIYEFNYPSHYSLSSITYGGCVLAKLFGLAMFYTNCSLLEILAAYHQKMATNHSRQRNNY
jgi:dimeric dUTPase (all-alpha-NTP-PPase superfamily)